MDSVTGKRTDAIKLAKASKWDELRRLVDTEPLTAQQVDSYGMLPLHWACTEPHSIGENVLMALLKAYPQGARAVNAAEMVPLQIAIKAQAKIEWLQALLASYPDAVLKSAPSGENAVELARKSNLPARSIRLLEEMYHHVARKSGFDTHYDDFGGHDDGYSAVPVDKISMSGIRPVSSAESLQHFAAAETAIAAATASGAGGPNRGSGGSGAPYGRSSRRPSNPDKFKSRAFSDNDFHAYNTESMYRSTDTTVRSTDAGLPRASSNGSGSGSAPGPPMIGFPGQKPLPYQTSTQFSSRTVVSLPPRWTNAPNCHICSQKFSAFKKRHHCRNCGQSICREHSARERMRLPHYGLPDKYRVCTVCCLTLKNAAKEMLQPSQGRVNPVLGARKSDEQVSRGSGHAANAPSFQLERHVSAPARSIVSNTEYDGIHDQVAMLQRQVSKLMEEKEQAEMQLRAQAERLGEVYAPERMTSVRRDRLNSAPITMPSFNGPAPQLQGDPTLRTSGFMQQQQLPSQGSFRASRPAAVSEDFHEREIDIDQYKAPANPVVPAPPTSNESSRSVDTTTRLQDEMGNMSFMSSYSEFDDRSTEVFDDLDEDHPHDTSATLHEDVLEEGDEEGEAIVEGEEEADDDEEDEGEDSRQREVEVLVNLGMSMLSKGSTSAAVGAFSRAVEICPNEAVLYSYLAKAHYANENLDDAVLALEKSLELEPSAANSTLLGKILFEKGDHERAIEAYQKSLQVSQQAQQ